MIITHHREKIINCIIYFANHTKKLGKTKLMKLLFFVDFRHFKETGKSITGLDYFAWQRGPVPRGLWRELSGNMKDDLKKAITVLTSDGFQPIKPKSKFSDQHFTPRELRILREVSEIFREAAAEDMIEASHLKNEPWDRTLKEKGPNAKIDYIRAVDEESALSIKEAEERQEEITEMYEVFGVS